MIAPYRVAVAAWLAGWFLKAGYFYDTLLTEAVSRPIHFDGLPSVFVSPWTAAVAWLAPALCIPTLFVRHRIAERAAAGIMVASALIGSLHIATGTDATFTTSLWASVWIAWWTWRGDDPDAARHARLLARGVVGLVFLGGAVGKLTGEYWSGEALYHIYFVQKATWPYPALRDAVDADTLRAIATWFSRFVIAAELALAAAPAWPHRPLVWAACGFMAGMVLFSAWELASVLLCLAGVLVASTRAQRLDRD